MTNLLNDGLFENPWKDEDLDHVYTETRKITRSRLAHGVYGRHSDDVQRYAQA
jgi:hypothetical protein